MRLAAFTGPWAIERAITDLAAGATGRLTGRADFRPAPHGLACTETGTLVMGGPPMAATRTTLWREAAGRIEVAFEDGRPFHAFPADDPSPEASHDCPPDRYCVRYDFTAWPSWQAEWRVRGPRKHYVMLTRFARPLAPAEAECADSGTEALLNQD
jgi:hypothetical protein